MKKLTLPFSEQEIGQLHAGEVAPTHIAGLPVAVNIQCHCVRCEKEIL